MKRLAAAGAAIWLLWAVPACAAIDVRVEGAVAQPGTVQLADNARLSDAALAAHVRPDAYLLGAAWLRPSRVRGQTRLRAGIVYDFDALHRQALVAGNAQLARIAGKLRAWLAALPVTGREPATLAPRVVEATPAGNWPVAAGDTLFYPLRPSTVRVVGAVRAPCTLALQPLRPASAYLAACARDALADRDWVWVIQPDGRVFREGVADWNRSAPLSLAPGAMVYVPIEVRLTRGIDAGLDHEVAGFLATQVLAGPAP